MKRITVCLVLVALILSMLIIPSVCADSDSVVNILLLGTDNYGYTRVDIGEGEGMSRSDAIYVLSLHPKEKSIKLLSIERDYLVTLPDDLGENKLGTATYFGGPQMAMDVINDMFDLDIRFYAHIDIDNLIMAIDLFGGVDVDILPEEVDAVNAFIADILIANVAPVEAGMNHLDGMQAWSFMGVRSHDTDAIESNASRNARQQRLLSAVIKKALEMDISDLLSLVGEVLPLITTNIPTSELLRLIDIALGMQLEHIEYQRTPSGPYTQKRVSMHFVVVPDNMQEEINSVHAFLQN